MIELGRGNKPNEMLTNLVIALHDPLEEGLFSFCEFLIEFLLDMENDVFRGEVLFYHLNFRQIFLQEPTIPSYLPYDMGKRILYPYFIKLMRLLLDVNTHDLKDLTSSEYLACFTDLTVQIHIQIVEALTEAFDLKLLCLFNICDHRITYFDFPHNTLPNSFHHLDSRHILKVFVKFILQQQWVRFGNCFLEIF